MFSKIQTLAIAFSLFFRVFFFHEIKFKKSFFFEFLNFGDKDQTNTFGKFKNLMRHSQKIAFVILDDSAIVQMFNELIKINSLIFINSPHIQ